MYAAGYFISLELITFESQMQFVQFYQTSFILIPSTLKNCIKTANNIKIFFIKGNAFETF